MHVLGTVDNLNMDSHGKALSPPAKVVPSRNLGVPTLSSHFNSVMGPCPMGLVISEVGSAPPFNFAVGVCLVKPYQRAHSKFSLLIQSPQL